MATWRQRVKSSFLQEQVMSQIVWK